MYKYIYYWKTLDVFDYNIVKYHNINCFSPLEYHTDEQIIELIKKYPKLKALNLRNNIKVTDKIYPYLKNIEKLNISYCFNLNGSILDHLPNIKWLSMFRIPICIMDLYNKLKNKKIEFLRFTNCSYYLSCNCTDSLDLYEWFSTIDVCFSV